MSVDSIHAVMVILYLSIWGFIGHVSSRRHAEADAINRKP